MQTSPPCGSTDLLEIQFLQVGHAGGSPPGLRHSPSELVLLQRQDLKAGKGIFAAPSVGQRACTPGGQGRAACRARVGKLVWGAARLPGRWRSWAQPSQQPRLRGRWQSCATGQQRFQGEPRCWQCQVCRVAGWWYLKGGTSRACTSPRWWERVPACRTSQRVVEEAQHQQARQAGPAAAPAGREAARQVVAAGQGGGVTRARNQPLSRPGWSAFQTLFRQSRRKRNVRHPPPPGENRGQAVSRKIDMCSACILRPGAPLLACQCQQTKTSAFPQQNCVPATAAHLSARSRSSDCIVWGMPRLAGSVPERLLFCRQEGAPRGCSTWVQ